MDGITFGALYSITALMPFDLKLLPVEEITSSISTQGTPQTATRTWRLAKPGEVELIQRTPGGGILRTVFQVDGEGRIHTGAYFYDKQVAATTTEYSYSGGYPTRIVWKTDGAATEEQNFSWSNGEMTLWSSVEYASSDSAYATLVWKAGKIATVNVYAEGGGGVANYTYPHADSAQLVAGLTVIGFSLKDGHIAGFKRGNNGTVYRYGSEVGVLARPLARVRTLLRREEGRDWLGRLRPIIP